MSVCLPEAFCWDAFDKIRIKVTSLIYLEKNNQPLVQRQIFQNTASRCELAQKGRVQDAGDKPDDGINAKLNVSAQRDPVVEHN